MHHDALTPLGLLLASLLPLALAPVLFKIARSHKRLGEALDGFVLVAVSCPVMLHVLPASIHSAGWMAALAFLLGVIGPGLTERKLEPAASKVHAITVAVALMGIVIHTILDGVALGTGSNASSANMMLAIGVVVHRLPAGLAVWMVLRKPYGLLVAWTTLVIMGLGTLTGFWLGDSLTSLSSTSYFAALQAFVGGMLMHVLYHQVHEEHHHDHGHHGHDHATPREAPCCHHESVDPPELAGWAAGWKGSAGLGSILGLLFFMTIAFMFTDHGHHSEHDELGPMFLELALKGAPALVTGYLAAGAMSVLLPQASISWLKSGSVLSQALRGVGFGLPLPICSCGVIPLYRSLITRGAPPAAAMAFLVATPELGLDAILLSIPFLGGTLTAVRIISAFLVSILVAWTMGRFMRPHPLEGTAPPAARPALAGGALEKLAATVKVGFGEVFASTAMWILMGLMVAALVAPLLQGGWTQSIPRHLQVPLFALLGMPTYICASGATPLVAVLIMQGVSPGAAVAFLLTGPATNVTTFGVLNDLHGPRSTFAFAALVTSLSIIIGLGVNLIVPVAAAPPPHPAPDGLRTVQMICLGVLGISLVLTLLRVGPRGLVEQMIPRGG